MNLRPAGLNHWCALVGGIVCAAALNRGRRADGILAGALLFSLVSAGGGLVVAGACLIHNAMVRPHLRRWLAVLVPTALYGLWWIIERPSTVGNHSLSFSRKITIVRELFLAPFHQVAFDSWPLAAILVVAFFVWGALQLRGGLVAGASFVAWTAAMIGWSIALIQSRGAMADPNIFRYEYLSLGFALLAVVPRKPIKWPDSFAVTNVRWLAAAAIIVLLFAGARAGAARHSLQKFSTQHTTLGQKAKGTMVVLQLGPTVIPDRTQIPFFGIGVPHGTAAVTRALMARYGSPFHPTTDSVDQDLVDLRAAQARPSSYQEDLACKPLTASISVAPTSGGEVDLGEIPANAPRPGPSEYKLWTKEPLTINVRRFGDRWVRLAQIPAGRYVVLTLPVLASAKPWEIQANGACLVPAR